MDKLIILIFISILFTSCLPTKSTQNNNLHYKTMLKGYERNQKAKIKKRSVYEINEKGKFITQTTNFDSLGRITTEQRYNWSRNFVYKDTMFVTYEHDGFFIKKVSNSDERNPNTTYYTFDDEAYLVKIVHDNYRPITYLLNEENPNKEYLEMIGIVGYRTEIPKEVDWSQVTKYTQRFHKNGLPFLFKIEEEDQEYLRIETTYDKKLRTQSRKDFYYNRLTAESTFEYDKYDLIIKESITTFPFEQQEEEKYSPGDKPKMRVFEYEYFE